MFFKTIHSRIKIVVFVIVLLMILVIFKVFYLQVIDYNPSFTVIIKIIFTNIDKFNVFLNLLHFLLVVLNGM